MYHFIHGASGQRWQVTARKEVILSAGVFNTPQLLMLSGIGDPAELTRLGIPTRVNLPSVGKNMTDHVLLGNPWRVNNNETVNSYLAPDVLAENPGMELDSPGATLVDHHQPGGLDEASAKRHDHPDPWRSFSWPNFSPLPVHLGKRMGGSWIP